MRVLIMGCGGIGSWLCQFVAFGIRNHTIDIDVAVADGDVVEAKNLLYSNFDVMDVGKNKAEALSERYGFKPIERDIQADDLSGYNLVIIATDDGKSRKMVYESGVEWIDLRSKGRGYVVFAKGAKPQEEMVKTLDLERPRERAKREANRCREHHCGGYGLSAPVELSEGRTDGQGDARVPMRDRENFIVTESMNEILAFCRLSANWTIPGLCRRTGYCDISRRRSRVQGRRRKRPELSSRSSSGTTRKSDGGSWECPSGGGGLIVKGKKRDYFVHSGDASVVTYPKGRPICLDSKDEGLPTSDIVLGKVLTLLNEDELGKELGVA
jgi:hypothetical protein